MYKIISLVALLLSLSSCGWVSVHKIDVEQGNVMTPDMIHQIHLGMTPAQVKEVMGAPVLINTFSDNRLDYVYTSKPGNGKETEEVYTLIFKQGRLVDTQSNLYSHYLR